MSYPPVRSILKTFTACAVLQAGLAASAAGATDDVQEEVVFSLAAREWTVQSTEGNWVVGYLQHRGNEATITFVLRDNQIGIYCEGYAINNLKNDITKRLQVKATLL